MTEQVITKDDFIKFILEGPTQVTKAFSAPTDSALPEEFDGFPEEEIKLPSPQDNSLSFARRLLEALGFGYPDLYQAESLIRSNDTVVRNLLEKEQIAFWQKTPSRPYRTLLFESRLNNKKLLESPPFKNSKVAHLDDVESALARMVIEVLEGFERGGENVTASVAKGKREETLCAVSILDEREGEAVRLVCFGTWNKDTDGLETFQLTEQVQSWELQIAREYLGLLYERQFKKLIGSDWKEAFTTTEERKCAEKLLEICSQEEPSQSAIRDCVLELLEKIARSFGLRKKTGDEHLLRVYDLPADHDIGIDPEELESKFRGQNPFGGVTIRDSRNCLLGYIIYPLQNKADAARLTKYLEENNRFHNVLVVYPDQKEAHLELWQGKKQLKGKLRKGQGYRSEANIVNLLSRFFVVSKAKVKNPKDLAEELAYRARYLRRLALKQLKEEGDTGDLRKLYNAFEKKLISNQKDDEQKREEQFADIFAQTITYGLLTARWVARDMLINSSQRFTRQTALTHLRSVNPFLENMFENVLDAKHGQRIRLIWLVEDIAALLERVDVTKVFGAGDVDSDKATDPIIHFYEPFLAVYDKKLKIDRGVFFTPRPVVSYIVRSVHELLQTEFKLEDGLASIATWGDMQKNFPDLKLPEGIKPEDPFVCILDPATGTGTFLFECIEVIERTMKDRWRKELKKDSWKDRAITTRWNEYVAKHLLPRLYGYELMMASYAIAHLKLTFKLAETGYKLKETDHLHIYLTNSLEPPSESIDPKLANMFVSLAQQAQQVNEVKRNKRFTVLLGNPPYSKSISKHSWIMSLINDFKIGLNEKKSDLNREEWKFLRFACYHLEASTGIFGIVINNTFLGAPTHQILRRYLLEKVSLTIVDLHGDSNKGETAPDGSIDENVFEIQQGVCIVLGTRQLKNDIRVVNKKDIYGRQKYKYDELSAQSLTSTNFDKLSPKSPFFFFRKLEDGENSPYSRWVPIPNIFTNNNTGIQTKNDALFLDISAQSLSHRMADVLNNLSSEYNTICKKYNLVDSSGWRVSQLSNIKFEETAIRQFLYKPFDHRFIYYHTKALGRARYSTMQHMLKPNIALVATRQITRLPFCHAFVSRWPIEEKTGSHDRTTQIFPLYIYPEINQGGLFQYDNRKSSLSTSFISAVSNPLGVRFEVEGVNDNSNVVTSEEIFNYIYSILYSPEYREYFGAELMGDFPRIPIAKNLQLFRLLSKFGSELVTLHLLEFSNVNKILANYIGLESPTVEKALYNSETVWLNKNCEFKGVPENVWNFHIGGYQVCEKWLKDRKGRTLSQEDIEHYQKIIVAISETIRIMQEIDEVIDEHGGWPDAFAKGGGGNKE